MTTLVHGVRTIQPFFRRGWQNRDRTFLRHIRVGRRQSPVIEECVFTTNCQSYRADETVLRDDESLHDPEAAGRRHLRQRVNGEKQRVWRTGGDQEVRMARMCRAREKKEQVHIVAL